MHSDIKHVCSYSCSSSSTCRMVIVVSVTQSLKIAGLATSCALYSTTSDFPGSRYDSHTTPNRTKINTINSCELCASCRAHLCMQQAHEVLHRSRPHIFPVFSLIFLASSKCSALAWNRSSVGAETRAADAPLPWPICRQSHATAVTFLLCSMFIGESTRKNYSA